MMVTEKIINRKKTYQCDDCFLVYFDKKFAKKCEEWCRKHKSCNLMITKHSVNKYAMKGGILQR